MDDRNVQNLSQTTDSQYATLGFEYASTPLVVLHYRQIQQANQAFLQLFGYEKSALLGQSIAMLFPSLSDYEKTGRQALHALSSMDQHTYCDERFMQHAEGELFWIKCTTQTITPEDPFNTVVCHFEKTHPPHSDTPLLTQREAQISQYIANGLTCKQIAKQLQLSPRTVEVHRANMMKKLGVNNKKELINKVILIR